MLLLLLIAILVGPIFSARCPSSCHCTRKAVLCVKSKKLNSLPDFSHTRFTVFYLQNSTLRSIKCTNLPDFVEILDIRNTWMKKQETCSLKNCPGKTIASLISSENCSNGTCKKQKTIHTFVSWLAYYYEGITTVRGGGEPLTHPYPVYKRNVHNEFQTRKGKRASSSLKSAERQRQGRRHKQQRP